MINKFFAKIASYTESKIYHNAIHSIIITHIKFHEISEISHISSSQF